MKLYSYFRSSASYRARIALHWKGLPFEYIPISLLKGAQLSAEYRKINPMAHVPALEHEGFLVAESMAIIQYLDEVFAEKPLFPGNPRDKATVLQLCEVINSGIQPLQNLKVQRLLESTYGLQKSDSDGFVRHWISEGLANLEKLLEHTAGSFSFGGSVTAADCFIIPQCVTAKRFGVETASFPCLHRVFNNALVLEPFKKAHPEAQPDFQK